MEEDHERKRRASIPRQRSCQALQAFRGGSLAKAGPQSVLVLGLASVHPALGRDLGDCLRNNFGLVFLNSGLVGRPETQG